MPVTIKSKLKGKHLQLLFYLQSYEFKFFCCGIILYCVDMNKVIGSTLVVSWVC